ncbi:hypothetical protein [Desulfobacula toluolica]|uniref:Conserved uncharacterized protein n=1 Tax=Desulfobacula toluolica (strain DSM 7467 / Tol2) TaxID=651182 RepID=K0N7T0_DESTT|nr:hypothetical protein [Desulfobacula toluolica]CCK79989.1 conserved uncharacterized protein [Desulfobacula toluolica Tol2]
MKTSIISGHSLDYKLNQFSASVKSDRSIQASKKSMELNMISSQFSISVKSQAFENFNKQGILLKENFSLESMDLKLDAPGSDLNQISDPQSLFGENDYWGVKKTSERISDFVLQGAGDDLERLKSGREGVLRGFQEAEKAWGGKLPDISYGTMEKSLEAIDEKIRELGGSVIDLST